MEKQITQEEIPQNISVIQDRYQAVLYKRIKLPKPERPDPDGEDTSDPKPSPKPNPKPKV